jgi:hypothetical protein
MTTRSSAARLASQLRASLGKASAEIVGRLEGVEAYFPDPGDTLRVNSIESIGGSDLSIDPADAGGVGAPRNVERTPLSIRFHVGADGHPAIAIVHQATAYVSMESVTEFVQFTPAQGKSVNHAFVTADRGCFVSEFGFGVQTSGTTPATIQLGDLVPQAKMASAEFTVVWLPTDYSSFEHFKQKMTWFRSTAPVSLFGDQGDVGGYPSSAGRVAVSDNGGPGQITLTGLAGKTMHAIVSVRLLIQV